MGILDKIKKEEHSLSNLDSKQNIFKQLAILENEQTKDFICNLLRSPSSYELIDKAYENTGKKILVQKNKGTHMYEIVKEIKKYPDAAHIGSFEALLRALWPGSAIFPAGEELELGQGEFFNEEGFVIKYLKEEPLYKRKRRYGFEGIIQVLYQSPIGSFMIRQYRINDKIFEISVSPNISKKLLREITTALEKTLDLEPGSLEKTLDLEPESREKQFRRELNVKVEHPSLDERQQEKVKSDMLPGIENSQGGISH